MDFMTKRQALALGLMFLALLIYFQILLYTGSEETALLVQKTLIGILLGNRSYSGTRIYLDEEEF